MQDFYTLARHFADSWALVALVLWFLGSFLWIWRPGSRPLHDQAAQLIFAHERAPAAGPAPDMAAMAAMALPASTKAAPHAPQAEPQPTVPAPDLPAFGLPCGKGCPDCTCARPSAANPSTANPSGGPTREPRQ